jgi:hypothetical protein
MPAEASLEAAERSAERIARQIARSVPAEIAAWTGEDRSPLPAASYPYQLTLGDAGEGQ